MSEKMSVKGCLPEQCEKEPPASKGSPVTGNFIVMELYLGFFVIPACWMMMLLANKEIPREISVISFLFGAMFLLYGFYKILTYGVKHNMLDSEDFPGIRALAMFVDRLR